MTETQMSFNLTNQEKNWIERLSKKEERPMSNQIRYVLKKYIEENYPDMMVENE